MTTHKTSPVKAKSIKKFMKMNGVDVKKCSSNGKGGVLVVVAEESREKAIKFFNEFGLNGQPNTSFKHRGTTTNGRWDVGNLYNWVEV